jgi:inner membrane protein
LDNVTHSLAGMLVAEAVCALRREQRPHVRAAAYLTSALGNNLPDSDIVYSWLDGPKPLGSLLHHRGHTHTLALALPMAWLLGVALERWFAKRHPDAGRAERRLILGLALAGPLLHLLMDFGNNYGVHPFWPISGRWFYGDSIFIVEPLWLAVLVPILAGRLARRWLRVLLWVVLAAVLVVYFYVPFFGLGPRLFLFGTTALSWLVARRAGERGCVVFAVASCLAIALVLVAAEQRAKSNVRRAAEGAFPALAVHDIATAPLPGNPMCWEALLAGEQGGVYRVLRATVTLAPGSGSTCRAGQDVEPTAPVARLERAERGGVRWLSEYHAELAQLSRLRREDCRFRALLRFARLPYVAAAAHVAGDLRYDRKPELDFSDVQLPASPAAGACPRWVPGWGEPRAELFQP